MPLPELDPNDTPSRNDRAVAATCLGSPDASGCGPAFGGAAQGWKRTGQIGSSGDRDVYRFDVASGMISRVSVDANGRQPSTGSSFAPAVSADGRYVAFSSNAPLDGPPLPACGAEDPAVPDPEGGPVKRVPCPDVLELHAASVITPTATTPRVRILTAVPWLAPWPARSAR